MCALLVLSFGKHDLQKINLSGSFSQWFVQLLLTWTYWADISECSMTSLYTQVCFFCLLTAQWIKERKIWRSPSVSRVNCLPSCGCSPGDVINLWLSDLWAITAEIICLISVFFWFSSIKTNPYNGWNLHLNFFYILQEKNSD